MRADKDNPWSKTVEPTVTPDNTTGRQGATRENHPAFATIQANRVSGSTNLFQSDFRHNAYITIRISAAEVVRDLSNDWVFSGLRDEYIEVSLSEAQWASFVSSMNVGSATPCTLIHRDRVPVPGIARPKDRREQFKRESDAAVQRSLDELDALAEAIKSSGLSGVKTQALLQKIEFARRGVGSTQGFIAAQFGEHMEKTVEHAKAEVAGYVSGAIRQLGIQAIANGGGDNIETLRLGFPGESNDES